MRQHMAQMQQQDRPRNRAQRCRVTGCQWIVGNFKAIINTKHAKNTKEDLILK